MQILKTALVSCALAAAVTACAPKPTPPTVVIEDKSYTVTPEAMTVKAGIVTAELTNMKVMERVEKESGRVEAPAKLTGTLKLQNSSPDQTVRLISGKLVYVDKAGQPIKVGETRTEPVIRFTSMSSSQLDPGQDASQSIDVDFPADALKNGALKEIRLDLVYAPTSYRQESAKLAIAIRAPEAMAAAPK